MSCEESDHSDQSENLVALKEQKQHPKKPTSSVIKPRQAAYLDCLKFCDKHQNL